MIAESKSNFSFKFIGAAEQSFKKMNVTELPNAIVTDRLQQETDRRVREELELTTLANKVFHKDGRTRSRAEQSQQSARKELINVGEEIQAARKMNSTYLCAVNDITAAANERLVGGFKR